MPLDFGIYAKYGWRMVILSYRQHLISVVDAFLARSRMKPGNFGLGAVNDAKFVGRLKSGQNVKLANADRVLAYIAEQEKSFDQPTAPASAGEAERSAA